MYSADMRVFAVGKLCVKDKRALLFRRIMVILIVLALKITNSDFHLRIDTCFMLSRKGNFGFHEGQGTYLPGERPHSSERTLLHGHKLSATKSFISSQGKMQRTHWENNRTRAIVIQIISNCCCCCHCCCSCCLCSCCCFYFCFCYDYCYILIIVIFPNLKLFTCVACDCAYY
jgi:hypothetical protein